MWELKPAADSGSVAFCGRTIVAKLPIPPTSHMNTIINATHILKDKIFIIKKQTCDLVQNIHRLVTHHTFNRVVSLFSDPTRPTRPTDTVLVSPTRPEPQNHMTATYI